jgi:tRNA(Ile)-lysidine synthase
MSTLPDIARTAVVRHGMLPDGAPVLALVSGGADSTALLRLLAAGELGDRPLAVLHVDHMLRGADSDADAAFVEALCVDLGVERRVARYDVSAYAKEAALNLEDAGRRVRYRFAEEELDALCARCGATPGSGRIATAHTRDDRVETFLMRVVQGAGMAGMTGVRPVRGRVVRPLIDASRSDNLAYLASLGQEWREDASNLDTTRVRAHIRHDVLPVLRAMNPSLDASLSRSLEVLGDDDALLSGMASAFARDFSQTSPSAVAFDRTLMRTLSRAMARRTVRAALLEAFADASRLESSHVDALVDGMSDDAFARDLPFGLRASCEYDRLVVSRGGRQSRGLVPSLLEVPGTADLGEAGSMAAEIAAPDTGDAGPDSVVVDADRIAGTLTVDSPREGDRFSPLGLDGTKKLSDLLVDEKVPRRLRAATPIVRDGDAIVWVAGVRMSHDYRVTTGTCRAVRLTWTRDASEGAGT